MSSKIFRHACYEIRFIEQAAGCEKPHTHSSIVISAVSAGAISLRINEVIHLLQRGVIAVIGPDMLHFVASFSPGFHGVYVLEIFTLPSSMRRFEKAHFRMFKSQVLDTELQYFRFINLCQQLLSNMGAESKDALVYEWLYGLYSQYYDRDSHVQTRHHHLAEMIKQLLDVHQGDAAPFDQISVACKLSKERCNRLFRKAYNISIQGYYLNKKAADARALLINGELSLGEIALQCGFYDQSHFSRIFRDIYQITPAKYRAILALARQSHTSLID